MESSRQFESRKKDHIKYALDDKNEASGGSGLHLIRLMHEALPDLNLSEVQMTQRVLGLEMPTPFLVSSMTAGHDESYELNQRIARVCQEHGWMMGIGSQRREIHDPSVSQEWRILRKSCPKVLVLGNIGIAQLIQTPIAVIQRLADGLEASAMIVHLNALQECMQPEGTTEFRGGLDAIVELAAQLDRPVIVKETGCGFSAPTLERMRQSGIGAVDVSGFGGTHWGRIEGDRTKGGSPQARAAQTFRNWGIPTVDSLLQALEKRLPFEVWASGGVRSGLDAAKLLALGAKVVGFAKPALTAALKGEDELSAWMTAIEYELKTALFCTGSATLNDLQQKGKWQWIKNQ